MDENSLMLVWKYCDKKPEVKDITTMRTANPPRSIRKRVDSYVARI